jgi:dTDP-4-amino-4,6-dideoxygalactose transaminase
MLRFVAPAGAPLGLGQIARSVRRALGKGEGTEFVLKQLGDTLGVPYAYGTSSGRAALHVILRALHRLRPDRDVVAVPAYVCFSVPAAVARAGLRLLPMEVDPQRLDLDFPQVESLAADRLLCILSANLFGLVNDAARIETLARQKAAFFVDDAAQALGATRNGRFAGTAGDAGFFSFGRGKGLASMRGGLIVTRSAEIAAAVKSELDALPAASFVNDGRLLMEMLCYAMFLNPRLYWLPNSLPFLKLGTTEFNPAFPATRSSRLSLAVVRELLPAGDKLAAIRRQNAARIAGDVRGHPKFMTPELPPGCVASYVRCPVIACDEEARTMAVTRLRAKGIGASPFYPCAICDIEGIERLTGPGNHHRPGAESLSRRLLTLPTGPHVTDQDLQVIKDVLWSI